MTLKKANVKIKIPLPILPGKLLKTYAYEHPVTFANHNYSLCFFESGINKMEDTSYFDP